MGVNHRRRNIFVSQQLLHRSDILAAFQELGRNSNVSKVDVFRNRRLPHHVFHRASFKSAGERESLPPHALSLFP